MNLEEFLVYIHNGAHELGIEDLKQLRLVSHTVNEVVLEYPILTNLCISTHVPDLEYLEVVSDNEKLLKHVSKLFWEESLFCPCLLVGGERNEVEKCHHRQTLIFYLGRMRAMHRVYKWRFHASAQRENLETNRDVALLMKILPYLQNVDCVFFTSSYQGGGVIVRTPAIATYEQMFTDEYEHVPLGTYWKKGIDGIGYHPRPLMSQQDNESEGLLADQIFKSRFWGEPPVRGLRVFCDLLSPEEKETGHDYQPLDMHVFFPKLKWLFLNNIPTDFFSFWGGGPLYRLLRDSMRGLQHINLFLMEPADQLRKRIDYSAGIQAMIQGSVSSLRTLELIIVNEDRFFKEHETFMSMLTESLPQLVALEELKISNTVLTTTEKMMAFGEAIRTCRSLKLLILMYFCLPEYWKDVLDQWKASKCMHHLEHIVLTECLDAETDSGFYHVSINDSAIVNWLHGKTDMYPLIAVQP
ncbi:hypothetical protein TSTA_093390 [Talaromyces stipitatus ATCC 10500]|uniref:F-box domain protein n=1 Tax=Talaromyces stipitatus (strain ATCC 10500 / CBS 375.48 / QM 6759 / NRRL 1006) TaxID=441959 RepID=B8M1K6_TALSN|nr:uncharacterized protein TSTA_093390 [Talaromyces stipitatus ATCC 10500]EED22093.1 hypothetical protein TSTA_093390 [Talaromyces stipitatus ATCC 10500]